VDGNGGLKELSEGVNGFYTWSATKKADNRTTETKIADIAMQLPAKDTETLTKLMRELIKLDNAIPNLASKLLHPGSGDDYQVRAAISGLTFHASQGNKPEEKKKIAEELCIAIPKVESDEIKDFLLIQLQWVAGNESIETVAQYLENTRLSDPAARVLKRIGTADAEKALSAIPVKTQSEQSLSQIAAQTAALQLITLSDGEKAIGKITDALKSDNKQYRQAALRFSANIKSPKMNKELLKIAQKEKRPEVIAEIITAFGERGDKAAWPFVKKSLSDKDGGIRSAAIVSAGKLAGTDAIAAIVKAMNTDDAQVITTGKNTLLTLNSDRVVDEVATRSQTSLIFVGTYFPLIINETAAALPQSSTPAKVAFLEILAERRATSKADVVFEQTSATNNDVRLAAYKALTSVVTEEDIPRIADLLNTASNKEEITALQQALFAAVSEQSRDIQTDLVVEQAEKSNNVGVYGNVLAMIGGNEALDLVMDYGFYSGDTDLKDAAFEALLQWSDGSAIPQLYNIAAAEPSGKYFDKALTAFISKTRLSNNTPEQKLIFLRDALEIARTPAQKEEIIKQIARTGTFLGLITAGKYLDDSNDKVQQAAVQTIITIALGYPEYYGKVVTELLNKAMQLNKDPEADYQKQAVLKHLAELPQNEGFVSMFNGKDLTGWKGLVENPIARTKMTPKQLAEKQKVADEIMRRDWIVENGLLVYIGKGYENLCSEKMYGDIELYMDWRIDPTTDSGVYLRGSPQVQIWDTANRNAEVGSGGLFNNQKNPSIPLEVADNPVNEWNSFYILMEGDKVTIYLNGRLVTDQTILENYWDRSLPIFTEEAIELQAHTTRVEFRDIYVREIPRPQVYDVSEVEKKEGFVPLFNGINMNGWVGNLNDYYAQDGAIVCDPERGGSGNLYTEKEYSDFVIRFEFLLTPAANNGLGIQKDYETYVTRPKCMNGQEVISSFLWATWIVEKGNQQIKGW
jgi:HEAT repeat protein